MASQSLYRKWRSQTFSDLIGQEAVVRTLLNAVRDGRLTHAYLFCGPRGTGKTSVARLLAKAVNCQNPRDGEPCNECVSCREIAAGRSPDVIEIDAASNTGIDNIREIRENANLMGSGGRYKVYVVDEVHMLSTQAFNALLKTLEEPPPHVIFVLATTEAHKVLPTVVSRCQRFDFRRIRMVDIVARLKQVAAGEGLTLEPAAADLLARAAQGGLRDALSLLDQAVAFCGEHIDLERTRAMLGLADVGALRRLIACVAEDRSADALDLLNEMVINGADLRQLNSQLAEEWRALMLAQAGADLTRVMDFTEEEAHDVAALAAKFSLDELMACARVFARNEGPARGLPVPQLALELSLLECLGVRRRLTQEAAVTASNAAAARHIDDRPVASAPAPQPLRPAPTPAANSTTRGPASAPSQAEELDLDAIDAGTWAGPSLAPTPSTRPGRAAQPDASRSEPATPTPLRAAPSVEEVTEPWDEVEPAGDGDGTDWVAEAQRNWPLIRKICRQKPPMGAVVGGLLSAADPIRAEPGSPVTLVIRAKFEVHLNKLREAGMREVVEWALEQALGAPFRVHFVPANEPQRGAAPARQRTPASNSAPVAQAAAPQRAQVYERGDEGRRASAPATAHEAARRGGAEGRSVAAEPSTPPREERGERSARASKPSRAQLEQAAREDPVVQEFSRMLKVEVSDVRALDTDHADE